VKNAGVRETHNHSIDRLELSGAKTGPGAGKWAIPSGYVDHEDDLRGFEGLPIDYDWAGRDD
jgi:hypothetical protein